jgi:hypothetical protein
VKLFRAQSTGAGFAARVEIEPGKSINNHFV